MDVWVVDGVLLGWMFVAAMRCVGCDGVSWEVVGV